MGQCYPGGPGAVGLASRTPTTFHESTTPRRMIAAGLQVITVLLPLVPYLATAAENRLWIQGAIIAQLLARK